MQTNDYYQIELLVPDSLKPINCVQTNNYYQIKLLERDSNNWNHLTVRKQNDS